MEHALTNILPQKKKHNLLETKTDFHMNSQFATQFADKKQPKLFLFIYE